ncbi:MAG: helix-turn-helix domain-containing protein [Treponema sp.]|nr:helix-turn-helix domain-containing protein [Treponema sp.]
MESLGKKLRTAREEKGWDYNFISDETNISTRYLSALEKEDFSVFPGEPYALGFIKNYGEFLGLDPKELLQLYRSIVIREQPVPVEQLLRKPSQAPKIIGILVGIIAVLTALAIVVFLIPRVPTERIEAAPPPERTASEFILTTDFLERRFYIGDSILINDGNISYRLVFAGLGEAVTITTPRGPVMLDLGQEVTVNLSDDEFHSLRIFAADFVKNDSLSGALLRFEQEFRPQETGFIDIPFETVSISRDTPTVLLTSLNPFPFILQTSFQGFCLFRYQILFELDRPDRNERFYQRGEEISVTAQNGIRMGISNAQAVRMQVIAQGRTIPFDAGGPGEVVAADLRWVRDEDNNFRLVFIRLE